MTKSLSVKNDYDYILNDIRRDSKMEVSFVEHETFLLYISIFVLFCLCCMLAVVSAQLYDYIDRLVKERDELLKLLGRIKPREAAVLDKNALIANIAQKRVTDIKEASLRLNEEVAKRKDAIIPVLRNARQRKIFIQKVLDLE